MNLKTIFPLAALTALVMGGFGCSKKAPEAFTSDQVPAQMQQAFSSAPPAVQARAEQAVQAFQAKNYPKALSDIQQLLARPDLTEEQRRVASQTMLTINENVQQAAAQGDPAAAQFQKFKESVK